MRYAFSNLGCEHAAYQHRVNCTDHREVQIPPVSGAVAGQLLRGNDDGHGATGYGKCY